MKKNKLKSLGKKARKTAFNDIKAKIADALTGVTSELGEVSKKLTKIIEKESGKFAKKISRKIKFNKLPAEAPNDIPAIVKPAGTAAKLPQAIEAAAPAKAKPRQKRASTKTAAPAQVPVSSVKKAPFTRTRAVKKAAKPG